MAPPPYPATPYSSYTTQSPAELVLRTATPFNFCVIDEVDSILIDEARTPLIIRYLSVYLSIGASVENSVIDNVFPPAKRGGVPCTAGCYG